MVDIERVSDWGAAQSAFEKGDIGPLVQFIKTWGAESEHERSFVAHAVANPPKPPRANGKTKQALADAYHLAKTYQQMMRSAGVEVQEQDLHEMIAGWLHKAPESINTLLHRHGLKGG